MLPEKFRSSSRDKSLWQPFAPPLAFSPFGQLIGQLHKQEDYQSHDDEVQHRSQKRAVSDRGLSHGDGQRVKIHLTEQAQQRGNNIPVSDVTIA